MMPQQYDIIFLAKAHKDYAKWEKASPAFVNKIDQLLAEMELTPREGTGRPHPLKGNLSGYWSRSFSEQHRILYKIDDDAHLVIVHRLYGHYDKTES